MTKYRNDVINKLKGEIKMKKIIVIEKCEDCFNYGKTCAVANDTKISEKCILEDYIDNIAEKVNGYLLSENENNDYNLIRKVMKDFLLSVYEPDEDLLKIIETSRYEFTQAENKVKNDKQKVLDKLRK